MFLGLAFSFRIISSVVLHIVVCVSYYQIIFHRISRQYIYPCYQLVVFELLLIVGYYAALKTHFCVDTCLHFWVVPQV